jgi:RNA polymerase-binding transcription factor DksA
MKEPSIRYSDAELEEFREHIQLKINEAQDELNRTNKQIGDLNESGFNQQGGDWYDDTSNHTDLEMLQRLAARQVDLLKLLKNALLRVQNKTYGICFVTGKLIDKRRLMLVPHTTKSVEGKTMDRGPQTGTSAGQDVNSRLIKEGAPKEPRPLKPIHARGNGHHEKDTSDWNGPSGESIEDAGYERKLDDE